jgi:D-beta-D-heptose 7-phosphate kinase/D-beta-D-heptose 1-phosphate adenosyltransferase
MQLKSHKIVSNINILKPLIESIQRENKTVVFTNGCFDIIHPGHIHILQQAKAKGDILVVGLNSDSSIKSFKSPNRPVCPQEDRAFVLASLSCVDYVIIFDEDTPESLIVELSPDVLVKGKDYDGKLISGSDYMLANGKKIELVDLINGKSTSSIIERIKKINF